MKKFTTMIAILAACSSMAMAQEPITETPEGTLKEYMRSNWYFYPTLESAYLSPDAGWCCDLVYGEDNTVYLKNPISGLTTDTWIKGVADDEKIVFQFPQLLYKGVDNNAGGKTHEYYINRMKLEMGITGIDYKEITDPEENRLVLYYTNDGKDLAEEHHPWNTQTEFPPYITGLMEWNNSLKGYRWALYGDTDMYFEPYSDSSILRLPEGLTSEQYEMHFMGNGSRFLNICLDGNDIYIGNLVDGLTDSWVKGTLNEKGDAYVIPSGQTLGKSAEMNHILFLMGADIHYGVNEETGKLEAQYYYTTDEIVFEYDAEAKELACDKPISVNCGNFAFYPYKLYQQVIINWLDPNVTIGRPATPTMAFASAFDDTIGSGTWCFNIYNYDENKNSLDPNKMGFNIYVDGEEYWLRQDEYHNLPYDMFDIPFTYTNNWDVYYNGYMHAVSFYMMSYQYVEVQSYYDKEDGTRLYSDKLFFDPYNSVDSIATDTVVATQYYDLQGNRVENPENGIFVKKSVMSDGSVKTSKQILR